MNRKIAISMGLLALLVVGASFTLNTASANAVTVKIGLLTPKTGALGFLGQSFEDGANLAIDELNKNDEEFTFELVVGDTETDSTATATAVSTMIADGVSGIVGAAASSNTLAAIAIAKDSNIPMISYASTSPAITDEDDGDFLYRVVPSDAFQGKALAKLMSDDDINKVAIIGLNDAYGTGLADAFKSEFSGTVSTEQTYPSDQSDFSTEVAAVKASDAEAVLLISFNTDGTAILKELEAQGVNLPLYGTDGTKSDALFDAGNFDGMKGTAPQTKNDTAFFTAFKEKYDYAPTIFVPETYDATMILGLAALEAHTAESCSVADNIRTIGKDYNGVSSTITFDVNGDQVSASYEFWKADSTSASNFTKVGEFVPDTGTADLGSNPPHCGTSNDQGTPVSTISIFLGLFSIATIVMLRRKF